MDAVNFVQTALFALQIVAAFTFVKGNKPITHWSSFSIWGCIPIIALGHFAG